MKTTLPTLPVLLAALLSVTGCNKVAEVIADSQGKDVKEEVKIDPAEWDREAEADIKEASAEARAWLKMKNNVIFEGSKPEVMVLTEQFYKAGCSKVYITGIEKLGGAFVSASMVVVLPTEPAQRAAAFKIEKEFVEKEGEDGTEDKGQKYLSLTFD